MLSVVLKAMSLSMFANNSVDGRSSKETKPNASKVERSTVEKKKVTNVIEIGCQKKTVTCSVTVVGANGSSITYSASAGNWFSSYEGARERCAKKLAGFGEPNRYEVD